MRSTFATSEWTIADIPDLTGRVAVITGGAAGLGLAISIALAGAGAEIVVVCRNTARAEQIRAAVRSASVTALPVDLADQSSVRACAAAVSARHPRIDLLINNAGTAARRRVLTGEGFESTLATNHLGHFALTGLLWPRLVAAPAARVVTVTSTILKRGVLVPGDLHFTHRRYHRSAAYAQSKLANLMFALTLARHLTGTPVRSVAAHPGLAATDFGRNWDPVTRAAMSAPAPLLTRFAQSPDGGALPILRAATDPAAANADFYGPAGRNGLRGSPIRIPAHARATDRHCQDRLWSESERLTGIAYPPASHR
ncbi:oxidoreductase [Nocardia aurantia]|uniref:Short-chain dehydrogenase n=1 Tax=Nocardia aurantia TaxID=2585199 RepID=A0A7K0DY33_9NOCA|nr:oxidoreductase [Nocardia aurantia]MQY30706.1 hypothetical protein [Nocardia aurantia]